MIFPYNIPKISVFDMAERKKSNDDFRILDVRERYEIQLAQIEDIRVHWIPLSDLARRGTDALPDELRDKDREIIVLCHHGSRSSQVVAWLKQQGWRRVVNMDGGIDAYAIHVQPEIGRY